MEQQLGVEARGQSGGNWVGLNAATDGFHDWAPLDDFKTTICGELSRFGTFEPTRESPVLRLLPEIPEHDWNIILVPKPFTVFDERFQLARRLMERGHEGDLESCEGRPCFEAEVTPHSRLLNVNAAGGWLTTCRRGQTLCTFGPWVGDGGHGYRPEIHPAERIWWRDGERLKLIAVQDASQRFRDHRQYEWTQESDPRWHPWAAPAMQGDFRVAFEAPSDGEPELRIDQVLDHNVRGVTPPLADPAPLFTFTRGGNEVARLRVRLRLGAMSDRLALDLGRLDVAPEDVCLRDDGRSVQGYVRIHDVLGYRFQDGEGFDAFEVVAPILDATADATAGRCATCGAPAPADDPAKALHVAVLVLGREEDVQPATGADLVLPNLLRAATEANVSEPALAAGPVMKALGIELESAWRFHLSVRPHYDGPRGERIEHAVDKGDREGLARLLGASGAPVPARVQWEISIKNFSTGEERAGLCAPEGKRRLVEGDECEIVLRAADPTHVLRVRAKARLLDADGHDIPSVTTVGGTTAGPAAPAEQEIRLASHFIRAPDRAARDRVLKWLEEAFVPTGNLVDTATAPEGEPDGSRLEPYRRGYYARMLRHGLVLAVVDRRITLDELRQFVDMARLFEELPRLGAPATRAPAVK
jgi:hypothetical protein